MLKTQKELHTKFWTDDILNSDIRKQLLQISNDFIIFTKVKNLKLKDIILTGSLANYTWHEKSDVDIHIIFDLQNFERHRKFIREYLQSKKTIWNENHDIKIHGFKVEIYPEDEIEQHVSSGKFSLAKNEWIEKPKKQNNVEIDNTLIKKKYQDCVDQILSYEEQSEKKNADYQKIIKEIEKFAVSLRDNRKSALKTFGEFAPENLAYKMLRNNGYIEKLHELKNKIYDKGVSIKETSKDEWNDMGNHEYVHVCDTCGTKNTCRCDGHKRVRHFKKCPNCENNKQVPVKEQIPGTWTDDGSIIPTNVK